MKGDFELEQDMRELHGALDTITMLFVKEHGYDYHVVTRALLALARNGDRFPITLALEEKIDALTRGTKR